MEFKKGDVVYFAGTYLGSRSNEPVVRYGILDDIEDGTAYIDFYEIKSTTIINGKSIFDFVPEEEWSPLPKKWTYNTPLFEKTWETFPEEFKKLRIDNPDDLLYAIKNGWLIKASENIHNGVQAEVNKHKGFRIRWNTYIPCNEPKWESGAILKVSKIYHTYEEAKKEVDGIKAERERKNSLSDEEWSIEEIDHTLERWAKVNNIQIDSERYQKARSFLVNKDDVFNVITRCFDLKLQWKYDRERYWENVEE